MSRATVTGLFVYPIKGCGGVSLDEAHLWGHGFDGDRRYMLVDADRRFVSQRTTSALAQVRCTLGIEEVRAAVPGLPTLSLPRRLDGKEFLSATVWDDTVHGIVHAEGSVWFSEFLAQPVKLVYQPDGELRQLSPAPAHPGGRVSLADGYPLLLTSESSLDDLNRHCEEKIPMNRFRPNVVVSGWRPYAEDRLTTFTIGGIPLSMATLCERCVVTTTDQVTGERGREPLRALSKTRCWDGAVWFGINAVPRSEGRITLGQEVVADEGMG